MKFNTLEEGEGEGSICEFSGQNWIERRKRGSDHLKTFCFSCTQTRASANKVNESALDLLSIFFIYFCLLFKEFFIRRPVVCVSVDGHVACSMTRSASDGTSPTFFHEISRPIRFLRRTKSGRKEICRQKKKSMERWTRWKRWAGRKVIDGVRKSAPIVRRVVKWRHFGAREFLLQFDFPLHFRPSADWSIRPKWRACPT